MGNNDITIPGDEAYCSFGGWAKPLTNPPRMHERRRYILDVECTDASVKSSSKGERSTRSLSIIRVSEVAGAVVPPPDSDENQPDLFNNDDPEADEGDEEDADDGQGDSGGTVVDINGAKASGGE